MLTAQLIVWLHVLALSGYFGAQFGMLYMLLPAAAAAPDEAARRAALIRRFKFYSPFSIGMLGLLVITGAWRLTDLKASMKLNYFALIGRPLSIKLLLAFLVIFIQTYIAMGLVYRIGRQEEVAAHGDGPAFTVEQVDRILLQARRMAWVTIILTAAIV